MLGVAHILAAEQANRAQMIRSKENQEEHNKMAIVSMARQEAEQRLKDKFIPKDIHGSYHIIDILEALELLHIEEERIAIDVVNEAPVVIKRHGRVIYHE